MKLTNILILALGLLVATPVIAEECPGRYLPEFEQAAKDHGAPLVKMTPEQKSVFETKKGHPPFEGDYDIYIGANSTGDMEIALFFQNDCAQAYLGPAPTEVVNGWFDAGNTI